MREQNTILYGPPSAPPSANDHAIANRILIKFQNAEKAGKGLEKELGDIIRAENWTEGIARAVLAGLVDLITSGADLGDAMKDAFNRAVSEAYEFAKEHPVYCTIIALGVAVVLCPWILEALGFGELGPVAESFAAWWQSKYMGYVPNGSLFSFFQRLGMIWRRYAATKKQFL